jgi:hypothetical protein
MIGSPPFGNDQFRMVAWRSALDRSALGLLQSLDR